jgi:DNA-binding IclR family transcriptional regulator
MRRDPIKSAARTLEVLELFHEQRRPLRLNFIFQRLSYPQSSTTTLLKSMLVLGYLNYHRPTRTYFPTPRVAALGDWVNHYVYGRGDLFDMMQFVFDRTSETVAVSSQNDIFIQHIRVMQPSHDDKIPVPEGVMRVLTHSAAGLALMSRMDAKTVDKLSRHINIYIRDKSAPIDVVALQQQLDWVRSEGYCLLAAFPFPEASAMAMPLPGTPHGIPLTLGVGGLNSRIARHRSEILKIMREAVLVYGEKLRVGDQDGGDPYGDHLLEPASA